MNALEHHRSPMPIFQLRPRPSIVLFQLLGLLTLVESLGACNTTVECLGNCEGAQGGGGDVPGAGGDAQGGGTNECVVKVPCAIKCAPGFEQATDDQGCPLCSCIAKTCTSGGKTYAVGDTFKAPDGCNTCECRNDGSVLCTTLGCAPQFLWYATCGTPACSPSEAQKPDEPVCTTEKVGDECDQNGPALRCYYDIPEQCYPEILCTDKDPVDPVAGCPI